MARCSYQFSPGYFLTIFIADMLKFNRALFLDVFLYLHHLLNAFVKDHQDTEIFVNFIRCEHLTQIIVILYHCSVCSLSIYICPPEGVYLYICYSLY